MTRKLKVFVSSAQKELEAERLALLALLTTDPFLKDHVEPILFERLPPPTRPVGKPYLDALKQCQVYVLMLDRDYAPAGVKVSPTQEEYDLARVMKIPAMALVKGKYDDSRDARTKAFFGQIKHDNFTYKRFTDRIDLKQEVAKWLRQVLKEERGIESSSGEQESGDETIEATACFESGQQSDIALVDLERTACKTLFKSLTGNDASPGEVMVLLRFCRRRQASSSWVQTHRRSIFNARYWQMPIQTPR